MQPLFLSYCHSDSAIADPLEWAVRRSYYAVWRDIRQTRAGNVLSDEVTSAIRDCSFFISLITSNYETSGWMENELTKAIEYKRPVIAIILGERDVPIQGSRLTRIHAALIDGFLPAAEFTKLVDQLEHSLGDPSDSSCVDELYDEAPLPSADRLAYALPGTRWSWCENNSTYSDGMTITFQPGGVLKRSWLANPTKWTITSNGFVRIGRHVLRFDLENGAFQGCSASDEDAPVERSGVILDPLQEGLHAASHNRE
jgi:hypothetical protein